MASNLNSQRGSASRPNVTLTSSSVSSLFFTSSKIKALPRQHLVVSL